MTSMIAKMVAGTFGVGSKVIATRQIVEDGFVIENQPWTHAYAGDWGYVIYMDPENGYPTVRFAGSGTATIVSWEEIMEAKE